MKVSNIVEELGELERKRDEISTVLTESAFGEPQKILEKALEESQKKVDTFLGAEFSLMATAVYVEVTEPTISIGVGHTHQISAHATLSNGEFKDITKVTVPTVLFRDFDQVANNTGKMLSVDVSAYEGEETTLRIVKSATGYHVDDLGHDKQGLSVQLAGVDKFTICDLESNPIGAVFTVDNKVATGDDWDIDIYRIGTGTTYESANTDMVTVDDDGLVTAHSGGVTTIKVINGANHAEIAVEVGDKDAPNPPEILSGTSLVEAGEVTFKPSTSHDAATYNVYIDGTLGSTGISHDGNPVQFVLTPADGVLSYTVTMTAVDTSGNESLPSNAVKIVPQAPPVVDPQP